MAEGFAGVGRQMSLASGNAMTQVSTLEARFAAYEGRVTDAEAALGGQDSGAVKEDLLKHKLCLAQLVGDLDKFQFESVDSIVTADLNSGKDEVRQHRKQLTANVTKLRERVVLVHDALGAQIAKMGGVSSSVAR